MSLIKTIGNRFIKGMSQIIIKPRFFSSHAEDPEELACRFECFFNRCDIDGWEIRQAMNDLLGYDGVPEPGVIIACLHACRRVNDYAITVRFLEAVKDKCGNKVNVIYPYIVQEIAPTLCELGCDLPETLCYHKPELWLTDINDIDTKKTEKS